MHDPKVLYRQLDFLEGREDVMKKLRPVMHDLVSNLLAIPEPNFGKSTLPIFRSCVISINRFEEDIETVERESLLEVIYRLGELVGLPRNSEFAEKWRGDW